MSEFERIPRTPELSDAQFDQMRHEVNDLINESFAFLPETTADDLYDSLEDSFGANGGAKRLEIVKAMFVDQYAVHNPGLSLKQVCSDPSKLAEHFHDPGLQHMLETMLTYATEYRHELGFLFANASIKDLPEAVHNYFLTTDTPEKAPILTDNTEDWYLCDSAEEKMLEAIDRNAVLLIENGEQKPFLVVKFIGKLSALCVTDQMSANGNAFMRGCWYSPLSYEARRPLNTAFDQRKSYLPFDEGDWIFQRAAEEYETMDGQISANMVVKKVEKTAKELPPIMPAVMRLEDDTAVSRNAFRQRRHEYNTA